MTGEAIFLNSFLLFFSMLVRILAFFVRTYTHAPVLINMGGHLIKMSPLNIGYYIVIKEIIKTQNSCTYHLKNHEKSEKVN